jgi:hypothetical protein
MTPLFIITSAVNTNIGIFDPATRMFQTAATIDSIKKVYPDSKILLVEGGEPFNEEEPFWKNIKARCNAYLNLQSNDQIKFLHSEYFKTVTNKQEMGGISGLSKTIAELTLMHNVISQLHTNNDLSDLIDVDRVFKITGRYQLSPMFDPSVYEDQNDKYIFVKRQKSWIENAAETLNVDSQFSSRLWSFGINKLDETVEIFEDMVQDCMEITTKHYIDMEHLLCKHFGKSEDCIELEHTHLFGNIGPNGMLIYD